MRLVLLEWQRFADRCIWSWQGTAEIWRTEASFRFWVALNIVSAVSAVSLDLTGGERALILALGVLILAIELINSAIERTIDYISKDIHPLAKSAKDAGSAAVAATAIAAGIAWISILLG